MKWLQWDGMKKLAADAVSRVLSCPSATREADCYGFRERYHKADADVTSLRSRLKQSSIVGCVAYLEP